MTPKEQNKLNRDNHEKIEIFDWALDEYVNEDFQMWELEIDPDYNNGRV